MDKKAEQKKIRMEKAQSVLTTQVSLGTKIFSEETYQALMKAMDALDSPEAREKMQKILKEKIHDFLASNIEEAYNQVKHTSKSMNPST